MFLTDEKLDKLPYRYLTKDFDVSSWEAVKDYLEALCTHDTSTPQALEELLLKYSELLKALNDELSWRYVRMTLEADNQEKADAYNDFFGNTYAPTEAYQFKIKELYYHSPAREKLDPSVYSLLNRAFPPGEYPLADRGI